MLVLLCLLAVSAGCNGPEKNVQAPAATVVVATRGSITSTLTVAGQFQPYQEVDLHAKVSGYIRRINVDIGDRVKLGQVLAVLEVPELDAQLQGAQAEVRHSSSEILRAQEDVKRDESNYAALHAAYQRLNEASTTRPGLIAQQELDDSLAKDQAAEAQVAAAKSALDASKQQLGISQADNTRVKSLQDYSIITAPFTGVVTMRYADTGSLIQSGTSSATQSMPVVRVAQSDLLRLRMPIPESDVPYIQEGGVVQIRVDANGRTLTGKIIRFTRALDESTRTMLAEVDVPNTDLSLSPGMYAETTVHLQQHDDVVTLPAQAVVQNGTSTSVLVVDAQNKVHLRQVTLGIQSANQFEILSGLAANERVILSGQANYQTDEVVRPKVTVPMTSQDAEQGGNN
jgi:RND family efflux transporter MFP subunit